MHGEEYLELMIGGHVLPSIDRDESGSQASDRSRIERTNRRKDSVTQSRLVTERLIFLTASAFSIHRSHPLSTWLNA